ncbi:MAG: GrpB family protein [Clostridia bacterium]|nr:GrpB family protein [Clostridia bacterium]
MFEDEKERLNRIFNEDSFTIEHVGSTAVKGLSAKPIIDIVVGINSFDELNKYKQELSNYYTIKENVDTNEMLLIKENENETFFLIHVLLITGTRYQNMIKFKNILINNKSILKEYETLKQKLAQEFSSDRKMYTKSKNEFIENILKNNKNTNI